MSSLAERLRTRTEKRVYNEQDSDDDDFVPSKKTPRSKAEKLTKVAAKKSVCQACGKSGILLDCSTCTCSFHQKCLFYYRKASADNWRCPECVNPLSAVCKILDAKTRSSAADENDFPQPGTHNVGTRHYLVKWKGLSYLHCSWVPEEELKKACKVDSMLKSRLNHFYKQLDSTVDTIDEDWIAIRSEWTTVDRIVGTRKIGDECEYFVKWEELPYDECSWEFESDISTFRPQIERYKMIQLRSGRRRNKNLNRDSKDVKLRMKDFQHFEKSPQFLSGGTLHPFQLEGLNFLRYSWLKNTHVILADEMGLGKTIQSIAFLASLFEENLSPHLVIAPLSTLRNWEREFSMWAPQLNVVMYSGSAEARSIIRQYEFFYPYAEIKKHKKKTFHNDNRKKQAKRIKFDVLLTSYEMINLDSSSLKCINWECMIVDEGHRLKNKDSKLFTQLKHFTSNHRVLLTGTPLQNNLDELFILMHYLDDGKFPSIEDFREEFKDINQEEQIARLHKILAPHLLRRVKKDVMKDLPSKKELILRVDLSSKQKEYYKAILTRNYQTLARRGGSQISLNNVVMELRKLCCHVYMLKVEDPDATSTNASDGLRELLEFSGKMQLLDKMMLRLKEQGHRVLIYSQFQHMLDLLEDYLSYRNWSYERIDGSISGAERQIRIDRFNAKNSTRFCFVLSTRAGGLGINLATADTVIIYDSDWNPHADLQAMARAHRLGQANKVMIYRLITRGTIEERMMQLTKKKMVLEHIVVGRLKERTVNQEELDDIIRYGSKDLFVDESDKTGKARQIHYDDDAVDRLLNRDEISVDEPSVDEEDDDLLKAFKVANFELIDEVEAAITREEEAKKSMSEKNSTSNTDRSIFWTELLRDKYDVIQFEESMNMGKGKRNRKQMPAAEEDDPHASSSDDDYSTEDDFSDTDIEEPGQASRRRVPPRKRSGVDLTEPHALMEGEGRHLRVRGFNQIQRNGFLQVLLRFGFGKYDWKEFVPRLKGKSMQEVHDYGCLFMKHLTEDLNDSPTFSDGVPKEGVRVDDVLVRLGIIQSIKEKLDILLENPSALLFPDDIQSCFTGMKGRLWKEEHDILLLKAILTHGYGRWQAIIEDEDTGLAEIVRQELNLPGMHGPVVGANQTTVNENSGCKENEISEPPASKPFLYHFREIQRKIADYIKKRYQLLEKAMNMELVKEKTCGGKTSELIHDSNVDPKVTEVLGPESTHPSALSKGLPIIEPIALQGHGCDDKVRLDLIRLYNKMCNLVVANTPDTFQMHCGDSSVSSKLSNNLSQLHAVCEGVLRVLSAPDGG